MYWTCCLISSDVNNVPVVLEWQREQWTQPRHVFTSRICTAVAFSFEITTAQSELYSLYLLVSMRSPVVWSHMHRHSLYLHCGNKFHFHFHSECLVFGFCPAFVNKNAPECVFSSNFLEKHFLTGIKWFLLISIRLVPCLCHTVKFNIHSGFRSVLALTQLFGEISHSSAAKCSTMFTT